MVSLAKINRGPDLYILGTWDTNSSFQGPNIVFITIPLCIKSCTNCLSRSVVISTSDSAAHVLLSEDVDDDDDRVTIIQDNRRLGIVTSRNTSGL